MTNYYRNSKGLINKDTEFPKEYLGTAPGDLLHQALPCLASSSSVPQSSLQLPTLSTAHSLFSDSKFCMQSLLQNCFSFPSTACYAFQLELLTSTFALKMTCSLSLPASTYRLSATAGVIKHCSSLVQCNPR